MRWIIPMTLLGLTACEMTPTTVEMSDVDDGMARELFKTVCKGLEMKDEDVRTYASENLQDVEDPKAQECYCERVWRNDELDLPIARGLIASDRDDMVECTLPALDGANVTPEDKLALVDILIKSNSKVADEKLVALARDSADTETRVLAISSIGGTVDEGELSLLHELLEFLAVGRACDECLQLSCVRAFLLGLPSFLLFACKSALPGLPSLA